MGGLVAETGSRQTPPTRLDPYVRLEPLCEHGWAAKAEMRRSHHPHACGSALELSLAMPSHATLAGPSANITHGMSSGRWHSQHPHAFGASLELSLCRPPTSRHDNTGTKHCNLQANVQNRLAHVAWGAASGRWHSQHPHAFWRLFGTAARAAFD
jgi:hypothetical protein